MPKTSGNINFITVSAMPDLEMVAGKRVANAFPMHVHEKYCLGIIVQGQATLETSEGEWHLNAGHIYCLNPGRAHKIVPADDRGFDHIVFCFGTAFLCDYWGILEASQFRFAMTAFYAPELCRGFLEFYHRVLEKHGTDEPVAGISNFFDMLLPFAAFSGSADNNNEPERDSILKVCETIKTNCSLNMSLDELAACAAMSKYHFCRVFRQTTGLSPYEFQLQARIKLAKSMLLNKEPPANIAAKLGFADQSHFHRFFKRDTGLTPGQFIKMSVEI